MAVSSHSLRISPRTHHSFIFPDPVPDTRRMYPTGTPYWVLWMLIKSFIVGRPFRSTPLERGSFTEVVNVSEPPTET